ncbi:MAG: hypothetical protein H0T46_13940 [Deltaproteobacteria bacterium]|nr:hypothetical protein [Deltaproteobacteria bacterium]
MPRTRCHLIAIALVLVACKREQMRTSSRVSGVDPALSVRIVSKRELRYDDASQDERPDHVRAASGIVASPGRLIIAQDDSQFLGVVSDTVTSLTLPAVAGRRRFEVALGNKLDKIDLESIVQVDDELWAFGSGSLPAREQICRVVRDVATLVPGGLYAQSRDALGGALNIEGAARVRDELWLFHRGNTGPKDPGPAVLRFKTNAVKASLDGGPAPQLLGVDAYTLGEIEGHPLGFTDAAAVGDRVFYLAAAEASANAIDDGAVPGSQLGVIDARGVRAAPFLVDGKVVKAEGIAFRGDRAWVVVDPDDPDQPSTLLEIELVGPW